MRHRKKRGGGGEGATVKLEALLPQGGGQKVRGTKLVVTYITRYHAKNYR